MSILHDFQVSEKPTVTRIEYSHKRKYTRIIFEVFSLITLEYSGGTFSAFKLLALGIRIAKIHFDNNYEVEG